MRRGWIIILGLPASAVAYEKIPSFEAARAVLEVRCLECHTQAKAKGDLILATRDDMMRGGEGGVSVKPGSPADSELLKRVLLAADV